jgi:hypothetical protein
VDDSIILHHPDYQENFEKPERQLIKLYNLRQIGDIKWFLGIRVERVIAIRQLYLVLATVWALGYMTQVPSHLFSLTLHVSPPHHDAT